MRPRLPIAYGENRGRRDAEFAGHRRRWPGVEVSAPRLLLIEDSKVASHSVAARTPALRLCVEDVVSVGPGEVVSRIAARRVVALVANVKLAGVAVREGERDAMGEIVPPLPAKHPSSIKPLTSPRPTFIRSSAVYVSPEPLLLPPHCVKQRCPWLGFPFLAHSSRRRLRTARVAISICSLRCVLSFSIGEHRFHLSSQSL